jgi:hypothetical protein
MLEECYQNKKNAAFKKILEELFQFRKLNNAHVKSNTISDLAKISECKN